MSAAVESAPSTPRGRHSKMRPQVPPPAAPTSGPNNNKEVSPLKQLQRMRESGTYKLLPAHTNPGDLSDVSDTSSSDKENSKVVRVTDSVIYAPGHGQTLVNRERSSSNPNILETGQPFEYLSPNYGHNHEPVVDLPDPKVITDLLLSAKMGLDMALSPRIKHAKPAMDPNRLRVIKEKSKTIDFSNLPKPIINVQLVRNERRKSYSALRHSNMGKSPRNQSFHGGSLSKSVDDLDKDLPDVSSQAGRDFVAKGKDVSSKSKGDVQTLLRSNFKDDEKIYSLPQPASYGNETLKAVKVITEKYDTLERRKMRALSFRENSKCPKNGKEAKSPTSPNKPRVKPPAPPPPPRPVVSPVPPPLAPVPPSLVVTPVDSAPGTPVTVTVPLPLPMGAEGDDRTDSKSSGGDSQGSVEDVVCNATGLTDRDIERVELFYKSHGTKVVVCNCLADLVEGTPGNGNDISSWEHLQTGVPTFVLNTGQGKRKRELQLVIAERETGFPMWQDRINYLSKYSEHNSTTHMCRPSANLRKVMSIRFFCASGARAFIGHFHEITANPDDELWNIGVKSEKKKLRLPKFKPKAKKLPNKKDISQPCNFDH
eukprot:GHVT01079537.1.p1 GENE.GHVT01079537.1~~GHVT01079537.1.p1  ORF type:complete len:596 (+),score=12.17 GHVT01079537.1:111-1898(+)